ncbi:MAG: tripartite tricarboxylate transporter substrate binding protein [Betaproteobacteria bacterium]|nr:tripartite tricarboxylate transporter substrate binding protein [Betaproteobacteria bacterium]
MISRVFLATFALSLAGTVAAQAYPARPIRFIVPFPPGGGNDTMARMIGNKLTAALGQQFVVDNRAGAGGMIGAETAARSAPDGYTLFLGGVASHGINPNLNPKLGYDPVRDFTPVCLIAAAPLILVVHPSVQAKTVNELIQLAKAKPGQLNFASNGTGGSSHLAAELFKMMTGTDMVHVPYKGLSPALTDLLSGQIQLMFSSTVAILPLVRAGRLRPLAMTSTKRSPAAPDVPTVAEAGIAGYETASWYGVLVPAGTAKPIVDLLNREIAKAVQLPDVRERLASEGADPAGGTPAEFAAHIKRELARWAQVIKQAKIKPD